MFLIFDTETTGFPLWNQPFDNKYQPRVCQIAAMLFDEEFKEVHSMCFLIRPDGWVITPEAQAAHGITNEICEKYGVPIEHVLAIFKHLMVQGKYLVAHNFKFDKFMLSIELMKIQSILEITDDQGICTMLGSTEWCKLPGTRGKYKWPKLEELYLKITGENLENAHDAMEDCRATAICFGFLVQNKIIQLDEFVTKEAVD